jgi:hypothetical protein
VSQAVSEMIENYLEENQMMLVSLFKKRFLQHKHVTRLKKAEMVQRKTVMVVADWGSCQIVQSKTRQNVRYILSRGIRLDERQQGRDRNFR